MVQRKGQEVQHPQMENVSSGKKQKQHQRTQFVHLKDKKRRKLTAEIETAVCWHSITNAYHLNNNAFKQRISRPKVGVHLAELAPCYLK